MRRAMALVFLAGCTRVGGEAFPPDGVGVDGILVVSNPSTKERLVVRRGFEEGGDAVEVPVGWELRAHVYDCALDPLMYRASTLPGNQLGAITAEVLDADAEVDDAGIPAPLPNRTYAVDGTQWKETDTTDTFDTSEVCERFEEVDRRVVTTGSGAMDVLPSGNLVFAGDAGLEVLCVTEPCETVMPGIDGVTAVAFGPDGVGWYIRGGEVFRWPDRMAPGVKFDLEVETLDLTGITRLEVNEMVAVGVGRDAIGFEIADGGLVTSGEDVSKASLSKSGARVGLAFVSAGLPEAFSYGPCPTGCECPVLGRTLLSVPDERPFERAIVYGDQSECLGPYAFARERSVTLADGATDRVALRAAEPVELETPIGALAPWLEGVVTLTSTASNAELTPIRLIEGTVLSCGGSRLTMDCVEPEIETSDTHVFVSCGSVSRTIIAMKALRSTCALR